MARRYIQHRKMENKIRFNIGTIFVLMFFVCFGIMGFYYLLFNNDSELSFETKQEVIDKNNSRIELEYPVFKNGKLDNSIDKVISIQKDLLNKESYQDLVLSYSHSLKDNLYSFSFKSLFFKEDKFVKRIDNVKYIDKVKKEEISFDKLVKKEDEYYTKLKYLVNNYNNANDKKVDLDKIDYNNLIFSENKIFLITSGQENDILIPVDYLELKKFLNTDYFKIDGVYKAPPTPVVETKEDIKEEPKEETKEDNKKEEKQEETNTKKEDTKKEDTKKNTTKNKTTTDTTLKSNNDGSIDKYIPKTRDEAYFKGKKLICFTFDDGPSKYTTKLLDGLKKRNARATFFMVGNRVKSYKNTVLRMKNEGHSIGQHTYSHKNLKKLSKSNPVQAKNEIYMANDAIRSIIGHNPTYIRPPYGAYNSEVLTYADMVFINWSIDPLDWKYKNANTVYKNIISKAYDGAIVLVHDLYETSVDGALNAMDYLMKNGYAIVSVDEMAKLRGVNLQTHHLYTSFKKK